MRHLLLAACFALPLAADADIAPPEVARRTYRLDGNELKPESAVVFETGGAKLKAASSAAIAYVRDYLRDKSYVSLLRIEVHTDDQGQAAANQALSEQRALAVARELVAKGVDCKRLIPVGFGQEKPVADNATAEGRARNRRVAFVNAALRGRPIGGLPADGGGKVAGDPCK